MKRIALVFGTRPEAVKCCPVVRQMREHASLEPHVCVTGQHREMLDQILDVFEITPDVDLSLMQPGQTLVDLTGRAVKAVSDYLTEYEPQAVLVQGDTTTAFAAALAAFYHKIPVGHIEAGLRTGNKYSPFPEEINRVLISRLAEIHFAPTQHSQNNLLDEGIDPTRAVITGNTVIDALKAAAEKTRTEIPTIGELPESIWNNAENQRRMVLITGHRRENFGAGFESMCEAIRQLAERYADIYFIYPVHLNPNVREPVYRLLDGLENVHLITPQSYLPFVALMDRSTLILTDSGGVQEEAPTLGKPVLVMRDTTERPEAIESGTSKLVGTETDSIVSAAIELLDDESAYKKMAHAENPYGDGNASAKLCHALDQFLSED